MLSPDFLYFFRRAEPDLRAFIGSVIRDSHAREDIFQEVSRTLWLKFDEFDLSRSFGAWARGIASMKILEAQKRSARFPLLFPPGAVEAIVRAFDESDASHEERENALKQCLDSLPPRSRGIVSARYEQRQTCGQIAQAQGISLTAIHQTLSRIRRALYQCITRRLEEEEDSDVTPASALRATEAVQSPEQQTGTTANPKDLSHHV